MAYLFNDLSLGGQYANAADFRRDLDELLGARVRLPALRKALLCSRSIGDRPVTAMMSFRQAVQACNDRDFTRRVLTWVASTGPFWEDERQENPDDCFHFSGQDVTEQGLGEAARRIIVQGTASSCGMAGSPHGCDLDELIVVHGLLEDPIGTVAVPNFTGVRALSEKAELDRPPPSSWTEMLTSVEERFPNIALGRDINRVLRPHPFSSHIADRTLELLSVLDAYVASRDANGMYTARTNEIISQFFAGTRARFTDESSSNKDDFEREMTFDDPLVEGTKLFCPFHGKINTPAFRIHFAWPLPATEKRVKVVYIGPKITR